jgi:hypothetical protein
MGAACLKFSMEIVKDYESRWLLQVERAWMTNSTRIESRTVPATMVGDDPGYS